VSRVRVFSLDVCTEYLLRPHQFQRYIEDLDDRSVFIEIQSILLENPSAVVSGYDTWIFPRREKLIYYGFMGHTPTFQGMC